MKNIKTLLFLTTIVFSTCIYAQSIDSLNTKYNLFKSSNLDFNTNSHTLGLTNINFTKNSFLFSSFNENMMLNNNYLINHENYIFNTSGFFIETNSKGQKINAFNPSGVSNFKDALIFGVVGVLLDEIQK